MDTVSVRRENLRRLLAEKASGNITRLAEMAGKAQSAISDLIHGRKSFGEKMARSIEANMDLPPGTLDSVKPLLKVTSSPEELAENLAYMRSLLLDKDEPIHPTDDEFALIPQLDVVAACGDGKYVDHVVVKGGLAFKRSSLRDFGVRELAARIIYASGGSMSPTIQDGCVVLINTDDREPKEGRVYAVCTPDGTLVLKRLIKDYVPAMGGQAWIMRSDNPDKIVHPDKVLPPDDRTMLVGRAVWNDNRL